MMRSSPFEAVVVDAHHDHGVDGVLGGHGQEHALGARVEVLGTCLASGEDARGLDHEIDAVGLVGQLGGVALGRHLDGAAVDHQGALLAGDLRLGNARGPSRTSTDGPEWPNSVRSLMATTSVSERLMEDPEDVAADAAESVDRDARSHGYGSGLGSAGREAPDASPDNRRSRPMDAPSTCAHRSCGRCRKHAAR